MDEGLNCRREEGNISDPYAVAIIKSGNIIGHVSCWVSAACNLFIQKGSVIVFPIAVLFSGVYQLYFPQLAIVVVNTVELKGNVALACYCLACFSKTIHSILDTRQRSLTVYRVIIT